VELITLINAYVGKCAVGFGEKERYTDFSGGIAKVHLSEEKMDMAFRLDFFCYFFRQGKKCKKTEYERLQ
jgi:hypothetical protein